METENKINERLDICYDGLKMHKNFMPALSTIYIDEAVLFDMRYLFRSSTRTPVVYTFHDQFLNIMYVGKTGNFRQRWSVHRKDKDLSEIKMVIVYTHASMSDACFNESQAIIKNQPLWNTVGKHDNYSDYRIPHLGRYIFIFKEDI